MRPDRLQTDHAGPTAGRRSPPTLTGSILLAAVFVALPFLASYPTASAVVAAAALPTRRAIRVVVERVRALCGRDGVGPVCVPGTDVCLGA